jgi:hypothetical protein
MKKLVSKDFTIDPSRLFIPIAETMEHLQEAYGEGLDEIIRSIIGGVSPSGGYILRGCLNTIAGGSNSITEGSIYFWLNGAAWSSLTNYAQYDLISKNGNEYISLIAGNLNHDPETSPTYWVRVGGHLTGQIFQVDAVVLNPLVDAVVAKIIPTYANTDPTDYTDGSTANVHVTFKIAFVDAVSGTGIADYADLKPTDVWHVVGATNEPAFQNSWVNNGGGARTAKYRRTLDQCIELEGLIASGASASVAFTLPVGFRPSSTVNIPCGADAENGKVARLLISTTGDVEILYNAGAAYVILTGVRFRI